MLFNYRKRYVKIKYTQKAYSDQKSSVSSNNIVHDISSK